MPDLLNQNHEKEKKAPSRLFTDYYASAVLMLIAVFVGVAFFVLRPMIADIKETNAETARSLETLEQQRAYLASLSQSVAASKSISPEALDQVNSALPSDSNIPLLLVQFSTAAAQRNIKIGSISFSEPQPVRPTTGQATGAGVAAATTTTQGVIPMDVALTLNAQNYVDVKRFLADLESSLRLVDVVGISTSEGGKGKETAYQLQLRTYAFGSTKSPAKP